MGFTKYIQIQCKNHFLGITRGIFVGMVPFFLQTLEKCTKKDPLTWWLICNLGGLFSIYVLILMSDLAHVWFELRFGTFSFAWHSFFQVSTIWGEEGVFYIFASYSNTPRLIWTKFGVVTKSTPVDVSTALFCWEGQFRVEGGY